jgi:hypothetical protein
MFAEGAGGRCWPISAKGRPGACPQLKKADAAARPVARRAVSPLAGPRLHVRRSVVSFLVGGSIAQARSVGRIPWTSSGRGEASGPPATTAQLHARPVVGVELPSRRRGGPTKLPWEARLLDHLVGAQQDRWRHSKAERLCGLDVNNHLEFDRQLNR